MPCELCEVRTPDGIRLAGANYLAGADGSAIPWDAGLILHGAGSNFHAPLQRTLAAELAAAGLPTWTVNTRGHDGAPFTPPKGERREGAAYEMVSECPIDIAAWIDSIRGQGHHRIALIGHSLGAIKAVFSQARQPHEAVGVVVACSPPRLSYAAFRRSPANSYFFETMTRAVELTRSGASDELLDVRFPLPMLISAKSYVDKYGKEEHYNFLRFLPEVGVPTLFTYGDLELEQAPIAFGGLPDEIAVKSREMATSVAVETLEGADHQYRGVEIPLAETITRWLSAAAG